MSGVPIRSEETERNHQKIIEDAWVQNSAGLYRFAFCETMDRELAWDLVQDTFVRAIRNLGRLRESDRLVGWLFSILRNCIRDHFRRIGCSRRECESVVAREGYAECCDEDGPEQHYGRYEVGVAVRMVLRRLTDPHREVLILRHVEGWSYQEIAVYLGCPVGTVMSRIYRARRQFRRAVCVGGCGGLTETMPGACVENSLGG
jgi:RNA polymerase sigma-70 factor (ECF subfamily)